jgi:hypothetical protein
MWFLLLLLLVKTLHLHYEDQLVTPLFNVKFI